MIIDLRAKLSPERMRELISSMLSNAHIHGFELGRDRAGMGDYDPKFDTDRLLTIIAAQQPTDGFALLVEQAEKIGELEEAYTGSQKTAVGLVFQLDHLAQKIQQMKRLLSRQRAKNTSLRAELAAAQKPTDGLAMLFEQQEKIAELERYAEAMAECAQHADEHTIKYLEKIATLETELASAKALLTEAEERNQASWNDGHDSGEAGAYEIAAQPGIGYDMDGYPMWIGDGSEPWKPLCPECLSLGYSHITKTCALCGNDELVQRILTPEEHAENMALLSLIKSRSATFTEQSPPAKAPNRAEVVTADASALLTPNEIAKIIFEVFYPGPIAGARDRVALAIHQAQVDKLTDALIASRQSPTPAPSPSEPSDGAPLDIRGFRIVEEFEIVPPGSVETVYVRGQPSDVARKMVVEQAQARITDRKAARAEMTSYESADELLEHLGIAREDAQPTASKTVIRKAPAQGSIGNLDLEDAQPAAAEPLITEEFKALTAKLFPGKSIAEACALAFGVNVSKAPPSEPAAEPSENDLTCSFCGKHRRENGKLITGNNACICDDCVCLCWDILPDELRVGSSRDKRKNAQAAAKPSDEFVHLDPTLPHDELVALIENTVTIR